MRAPRAASGGVTGGGPSYSTYLGGNGLDAGAGIATDGSGDAFIVGSTSSADFPRAQLVQATYGGGTNDAFVAELATTQSGAASLVYSTYLVGSGIDTGAAIAVDSSGNADVVGSAGLPDFPVSQAVQVSYGGVVSDAFVAQFAAGGSLTWSSYLGGSGNDNGNGVAATGGGGLVVTGASYSTDLPTVGAEQGTFSGVRDVFVAQLSVPASSSRLVRYAYDRLGRLTGATETPGVIDSYLYDVAGNRTRSWVNWQNPVSSSYDAADQVVGWTYDAAGNLTSDGVTSYSYDALGRLTGTTATGQTRGYTYNGDGTLVAATANGATTTYTEDLASALSQVLATSTSGGGGTDFLYGAEATPFAATSGTSRSWYGTDGQGSVRQLLTDTGNVLGSRSYDPYGQVESGATLTSTTFGYGRAVAGPGHMQYGITQDQAATTDRAPSSRSASPVSTRIGSFGRLWSTRAG